MPVYKDEQRGTFFCSFSYTDWTGEKKKKTKRGFKLKREAQAFERSFLEQTQGEMCIRDRQRAYVLNEPGLPKNWTRLARLGK